uniref:Vacuolar-sorting protein SNF8 n=1 Tax=Branchiostoma floridae TaxID=7739 RepID=C3ZHM1_BRAFL|eukprot:XP_002592005.1 hypothetical protein BRAFLDRAFT_79594 [Branchiostoma floridae]
MRRRGVGAGAIAKKKLAEARYKDRGTEIAADQLAQMSKQLETFQKHLEEFATKHKDDIRRNAEFRRQFQEMCAAVGVDPLASGKGFWSEMLGIGDFYYELGVQIVEVCLATKPRNGGKRGDDLLRAIKKLKVLGSGFTAIPVGGGRYLVQSVPGELNMDHTTVLQLAEGSGFVSESSIVNKLRWETERAQRVLDHMVKEGLAWVDDQATEGRQYWFPALFPDPAG